MPFFYEKDFCEGVFLVFVNNKHLPLKSLEAHIIVFVPLFVLCMSVFLTLLVTDMKYSFHLDYPITFKWFAIYPQQQ